MTTFAIVLNEPNESVARNIKHHFPGHFEYSKTFYLLESELTTGKLTECLGIKGENQIMDVSGFVLRLNDYNYAGYTSRDLWEWLSHVE